MARLALQWPGWMRRVVAVLAIVFCLPAVLVFVFATRQVMAGELIATPRGEVALLAPPGAPEILERIAALPPGDGYFFYPFMPTMAFLTAREHVARYDVFTPGYTLPSQYQEACVSVLRLAKWVVVDTRWTNPVYLKMAFPAMEHARPHETAAFEAALDSAFALVARDGDFELRHRRDGVGEAVCADVAR
jgi:hypothetical protein